MIDRPTPAEMLAALRQWIETGVLPAVGADPSLRFQSLIAMHLLGILEREVEEKGEDPKEARDLCDRIRAGEYDAPSEMRELLGQLKEEVRGKVAINNPRYPRG